MVQGKREIKTRLAAVLDDKGITSRKAAEVAGVTPGTLSRYSKGVSTPPWEVILKLSKWLGEDPEWLFPQK